jgi:hypothetical protein
LIHINAAAGLLHYQDRFAEFEEPRRVLRRIDIMKS